MNGTAKTARFSDDLEESKKSEEDVDDEEQDDQLASLPRMPKATAKSAWQIHQEYNSMRDLNVNRYDVHVYMICTCNCLYDMYLQKIDRCRRLTNLSHSPSLKHTRHCDTTIELPEQTVSEHQIRFIHPQRI